MGSHCVPTPDTVFNGEDGIAYIFAELNKDDPVVKDTMHQNGEIESMFSFTQMSISVPENMLE